MTSKAILSHLFESYGRSISLWIGISLTLVSQVIFRIAIPVAMALFVTGIVYDQHLAELSLLWLVVAYLCAVIVGYTADHLFIRHSDARYECLVGDFHDSIMMKPVRFFRDEGAGNLSTLFRNHMDATINLFRYLRKDILPLLVAAIGPFIVFFPKSLAIACVFLLATLLRGYVSYLSVQKLKPYRRKALEKYSQLSGVMADQMAHFTVVRASANEQNNRANVTLLASQESELFWVRHRRAAVIDALGSGISATCFLLVMWMLVSSSKSDREIVYMTALSLIFITQGMEIAQTVGDFHQRCSERWEQVKRSLEKLSADSDSPRELSSECSHPKSGSIEFSSVDFAYGDGKARVVFKSLNLAIQNGKHVAVTGENGVGKSTLINLLMRFDRTSYGEIRIGGANIDAISSNSLYRSIGYVPQEPKLFNLSLKENLMFFEPNAPETRIQDVFDLTGISDLISKLDGGLNYNVGEMGSKLSGGQRQRVAIARALLRDAPIYLFDEPTSSLSHSVRIELVKKIRAFLSGRTLILVTHSRAVSNLFDDTLDVSNKSIMWI